MVANAFSRIPNDLVVESFSYALQSVVVPTWMHNGDPTTTELIEQLCGGCCCTWVSIEDWYFVL